VARSRKKIVRRWARRLLLLALLAFLALLGWGYARNHPEDLPWTPLDLSDPVGAFTGRKLTGLNGDGGDCRALLRRAGISFTALPPRAQGPQCGFDDGVRLAAGGALPLRFRPEGLGVSCPVAAGVAMWNWNFIQPAALRRFGKRVASVEHFGSYNCRRIYGRRTGNWSEHSRANALDVAGFRLEDGTRISVAEDWQDKGAKGRFLRDVRDGACRLFATTLSPDYNAAHRDHLHLDQARRGEIGWRACR
jgi:hypothetical protein